MTGHYSPRRRDYFRAYFARRRADPEFRAREKLLRAARTQARLDGRRVAEVLAEWARSKESAE